jgi:hypothetical protein
MLPAGARKSTIENAPDERSPLCLRERPGMGRPRKVAREQPRSHYRLTGSRGRNPPPSRRRFVTAPLEDPVFAASPRWARFWLNRGGMKLFVPTAIASISLLALPGTVRADETAPSTTPFALETSLGLATPLGIAGVSGEFAVHPRLDLTAGVGLGREGVQLSFMPRFNAFEWGRWDVGVGAGFSIGAYSELDLNLFALDPGDESSVGEWDMAPWANAEVTSSLALSQHLRLRWFYGMSYLLDATPDGCTGGSSCDEPGRLLPYFGIGLARQF